eukprot:CAMPEP_0202959376 /NCGR_PEP_ID=MMETSP1396-20130829/3571_1 /ASSEMBLY_ACC=CAM_ASM_000872 /TAXON_ID= /ORGANISM="Pseudokeronopsis sp., Strain Brazil" /LENGTH=228 /DNA_ID=CAMNT_0049677897 /DNA_START=37 /DNA_END=723 /DNA_ORIENTATION=-
MMALGMGATLALLGVGSLFYSMKLNRDVSIREKELVISSSSDRFLQDSKLLDEEAIANSHQMKKLRKAATKVTLYFDENDEMMEEEDALKLMQNPKNKGKIHSVVVDFGNEEGTQKITKDIFWGSQRDENAQIFIENYQKTKKSARVKKMDWSSYKYESDASSCVEMKISGSKGEVKDMDKEKVLLDLNPDNFEKPQDHLFFDFFSLYAKNFIKASGSTTRSIEVLPH